MMRAGNAAGWNPGSGNVLQHIQSPIDIEVGTLVEATFTNPSEFAEHETFECQYITIDPSDDRFSLECNRTPQEGATLIS